MENKKIVLQKGKSIKFLDYTIKNSSNNDGLVLFKEGYLDYESHLGNYGTGTQDNIDTCKKYAILFFMAARPQAFATILVRRALGTTGTYLEWFVFTGVLKKEGIDVPQELTQGSGANFALYFKGQPLAI